MYRNICCFNVCVYKTLIYSLVSDVVPILLYLCLMSFAQHCFLNGKIKIIYKIRSFNIDYNFCTNITATYRAYFI